MKTYKSDILEQCTFVLELCRCIKIANIISFKAAQENSELNSVEVGNLRGALITVTHFTLHSVYDEEFPAHNFSKLSTCVHTCNFNLINAYLHTSRNYSVTQVK